MPGRSSGLRAGEAGPPSDTPAEPSAAGTRRVLWLVSVLFLVEGAMYSAVAPLLAHYAQELGLSKSAAGVLAGSYGAGVVAGSLAGWWLSVRVGVRSTTLIGLGLFAAASVAIGFGKSVIGLEVLRAVQGVASGCIWGGALTWLIAAAPPERIGRVMGIALSIWTIGNVIGPVIGTLAATVSTAATFGGVGLVALCLMGWASRVPAPPTQRVRGTTSVLSALRHDRPLALGGWIILLEAMAFGVSAALIPLRLAELGAAQVSIGVVFLVSSVAGIAAALIVGWLSDRRPPTRVIQAGLLIAAPLLIGIGLAGSSVVLGVLTIVCVGGALSALGIPATTVMTHRAERIGVALATAMATYNFAFAIGETIGAPAGATLAHATSDLVPFAALAGVMLATLAGISTKGRLAERRAASADESVAGGSRGRAPEPIS